MTKKAADPTTTPPASKQALKPAAVTLLFLDTSTRLFVPSIGGTVLGLWADKSFNTVPYLTLLGVTLGSAVAFSLVYLQLKAVKKKDDQKDNI